MQSYRVPAAPVSASIHEKKSEFIASLSPANTEQEALAFLEKIRAEHRTASHNVYAYVLREDNRQRYSDDGEPAKTAGLPVLGAITHNDITNCIIVVTRYFGGTLLGTGGLVRAYSASASAAVQAAKLLTIRLCVNLSIQIEYSLYEQTRRILEEAGATLQEPSFTDVVLLQGVLPFGEEPPLVQALEELTRGAVPIEISKPYFTHF